jgi:hypothetical protein
MWSKVRQLIERLDVTGEHDQFAQAVERFEDDLEQAWAESEDGGSLLWLAASVGVDCHQIVVTAHALLGNVSGQKTLVGPLERRLGQQMVQVLEKVHAWNTGKQSAEHVSLAGLELYRLCEDLIESYPLSPEMDHLTQAVIWLTTLVGECPPLVLPDDLLEQGSWCLVDHVAHASALHQRQSGDADESSESHHRAYVEAMHRAASVVRRHITGTQVQEAARQRGVWPLP